MRAAPSQEWWGHGRGTAQLSTYGSSSKRYVVDRIEPGTGDRIQTIAPTEIQGLHILTAVQFHSLKWWISPLRLRVISE